MVAKLNDMRIVGLPPQFVVVVAVSLALTIFFGAWAADARIEARSQQFTFSNSATYSIQGAVPGASIDSTEGTDNPQSIFASHQVPTDEVDRQGWETAFLFACPLH